MRKILSLAAVALVWIPVATGFLAIQGCSSPKGMNEGYYAPLLGRIPISTNSTRATESTVYVVVPACQQEYVSFKMGGRGDAKLLTPPLMSHLRIRTLNELSRRFPTTRFQIVASTNRAPRGTHIIAFTPIEVRTSTSSSTFHCGFSSEMNFISAAGKLKSEFANGKGTANISESTGIKHSALAMLDAAVGSFAQSVAESAVSFDFERTAQTGAATASSHLRTDVHFKGASVSHQEGLLSIVGGVMANASTHGDPFYGELSYSSSTGAGWQSGVIPVQRTEKQHPEILRPLVGNWKTDYYSYTFPILADSDLDEVVLVEIRKGKRREPSARGELLYLGMIDSSMHLDDSVFKDGYWFWFRPKDVNAKVFINKESKYDQEIHYDSVLDNHRINFGYRTKWDISRTPFE